MSEQNGPPGKALPRQPMKPPIALWLLISTLASNKASPLGASLYNTYKNNNIPTGAGAYAYAREILPKALSLYSCGGSDKKSKKVARVFGRFRGYIWRALKFLKKVFLFGPAQTSSISCRAAVARARRWPEPATCDILARQYVAVGAV